MDGKVYYPIFLDLTAKAVLVAGGGKVGLRKARGLVEAGALVTVVSPRHETELEELGVRILSRGFEDSDLNGMTLVLAATDNRAVNRHIADLCKQRGIPVNVADAPEECDFLVPARVRQGDLQIAISTSGTSPSLAKDLRQKLELLLRG